MGKKKLLVGGLGLAVIGISSLAFISKPTYQEVSMNDLESEKIALYIKNDTGNYEKANTIPTSGYILNEEKSRCNNNAKPSWNKATNSLKIKDLGNDNTSCYLYFDKAPTSEDTLVKLNITNINTTTPDFSQVATADEGIYAIEDGMYGGTSYYWRGAVTNNYVKFANFCWRIVRINGDGSIRLIYDGTTCHANGTTGEVAVANQAYNTSYDRSEYVGYTFISDNQRPNNTTTEIVSNLKAQIDDWYNNNIENNVDYVGMVTDGRYCNDRTVGSGTWSSTGSDFYYSSLTRRNSNKPSLACYNEDIYILKVGNITSDETIMAGGGNLNNNSYFLYNGNAYWTMSPSRWNISKSIASTFFIIEGGQLANDTVSLSIGIRPVINLRSDVQIKEGTDGTLNNPYVVEGA